jgi:hypothetical protein
MVNKRIDSNQNKGYQRPGSNTVVLHYDSVAIVVLTLPFFIVGLIFVAAPWGLASNSDKLPLVYKFVISAMGLICTSVPFIVFKNGLNETVLDRSHNRIYIRQRFTNKITRQIDCNMVDQATIESLTDSDGTSYKVNLRLKSSELVSLGSALIATREGAMEKRDRINRLLQNPYEVERSGSTPSAWAAAGRSEQLRTFILVCAIIAASPFVGWWIAAQEKPVLHIAAGAPSPTLNSALRERAAGKLHPGETIEFVAMPEPGHEGMAKIWFIPFAIVWTIFSGCWTLLAIYGSIQSKSIGAAFMALFGLPFVALGVCMLLTPYFSYKRELQTVYALTDQRAIAFEDKSGFREIVRYDDRHFGPVLTKPYGAGRADVMFRSNLDVESPGVTGGFWGIEQPELAASILKEKLEARAAK